MKNIFIGVLLIFATTKIYSAECEKIKSGECDVAAMPLITKVDDFLKSRDSLTKNPWVGASLFLHALILYQYDQKEAEKLIVLSLHESRLDKISGGGSAKPSYNGYGWRDTEDYLLAQVKKIPQCMRSFASGATPTNGYIIDKNKLAFKFRVQAKFVGSVTEGKYKVFVCTSGAGTCRPMSLQKNAKGYWKVVEFSSVAVGCAASKEGPTKEESAAEEL